MKATIVNITEAINALVDEFFAEREPGDYPIFDITIDNIRYYINCGHCEEFANIICERIEGAKAYWGDEFSEEFWDMDIPNWVEGEAWSHCFVVYKGRYYDSEAPRGVDHPKDLPLYINHATIAKAFT